MKKSKNILLIVLITIILGAVIYLCFNSITVLPIDDIHYTFNYDPNQCDYDCQKIKLNIERFKDKYDNKCLLFGKKIKVFIEPILHTKPSFLDITSRFSKERFYAPNLVNLYLDFEKFLLSKTRN